MSNSQVCYDDEQTCDGVESENLSAWLALFIFAQFILGCASGNSFNHSSKISTLGIFFSADSCWIIWKVTFYTVGFSFVEDSAPAGKGAILFGLIRMASAIGPVFGYIGTSKTFNQFRTFWIPRWRASIDTMGRLWCYEWRRCDYRTRWSCMDWSVVGWHHLLFWFCFYYFNSFLWIPKIYSWNCQGSVRNSCTCVVTW